MPRLVAAVCGVALSAGLLGCAGRIAAPVGEPVPDPAGFAESLRLTTVPPTPLQYTFSWSLVEQGSTIPGRGAVRAEAPERLRLDLFGQRGETYLIAALVGQDYRLPPEAANAATLPSPTLLWGALGILQPPIGARITSATTSDRGADLRFELPGGQLFVFTFARLDENRFSLSRIERASSQGVLETLSVDRAADGTISRTRYRDWTAFRDLTLQFEAIRRVQAFDPAIWSPNEAGN